MFLPSQSVPAQSTCTLPAPATDDAADAVLLDRLQHDAFNYFLDAMNPRNGLIADNSRTGSPSSIAAVGFALSAYPIGIERGWIDRAEAVRRTLLTLRFLMSSDQSDSPHATGHRGFYYHFLDMGSGTRTWLSELSLIDTALLIVGALTAASYFTAPTVAESEVRDLADALYGRVDWRWAQPDGVILRQGWKPESGFLHYGWEGYSEAIILYALGLGSPTHPLTKASFEAWTVTYQWENLYGRDFLYAGPLFIHQFSHAWIDFRGIRDRFMREKDCDYFENSRRATYIQRDYAILNPGGFNGYAADCWGLSAGDGPSAPPRMIAGRRQAFYGYAARGVPYGPDDGTIAGSAMLASLAFAPEIVLPALRAMDARAPGRAGELVRASGFNASVGGDEHSDWVADAAIGIDQGIIVLMIENYRSGLPWRLGRSNPHLRRGLRRAGFRGGWL